MRLDDLREQLEVEKADYESRKRRALDFESKFIFKMQSKVSYMNLLNF